MALGTGPKVRQILITKTCAVLDGMNPTSIPIDPGVTMIASDQETIGWDQIMKGRFAKSWNTHARTQPGTEAKYLGQWMTNVVDFIYTHWWKPWESRNQDRHGHDLTSRLQADVLQTKRELTMFYNDFTLMTPQHLAWLFDTPIEVRQQWPAALIRQWLNTWRPFLIDITNPKWSPHNQENYPYQTELNTGYCTQRG